MSDRNARQRALIARAQAGDEEAMELMLTENFGLILKAVNVYKRRAESMEEEDVAQIARLGVVDAVRTFDLERGTRFSTHAWMRIRGQMTRYLRQDKMIILPAWVTDTPEGRAKGAERGIPVAELRLEHPMGDSGDRFEDFLAGDEDTEADALANVHRERLIAAVREALADVPERDREDLLTHYGFTRGRHVTLEQLAHEQGSSRQSVQQRIERTRRVLRERLAAHFGEEP